MADYTLSAKITGDSSGFKGAISEAKSSIESLQSKIADAGSKMQSIGKSISGVGSTLTSKITKPAMVATSALAGITLVKGFDRLTGIDDARAKLMGLGHDAGTVDKIMESATASVKGTAFGMAEAATTAAGATAAGVKQGEELTRYLSLTADAAAIAGTSMSEMGSIVNKVTTSGRAMTENLEQLSDRGLPIYQWLGEAAGVAASDIKDMASSGEISSEMFMNAIEKNIGGAAQIMGQNSFKSTIANIGASIGRIGANFLDAGGKGGGFFSTLKPMLADFNTKLGSVEAIAGDLGVKFGESFQKVITTVKDLKAKFDSLSPTMQNLILKSAGMGAAFAIGIGPALKIIGPLVTGFGSLIKVIGLLASPVGLITAAIIALVAGFAYLMATNEEFRTKMLELWEQIKTSMAEVWPSIQEIITTVFQVVADMWNTVLKPVFDMMLDLIVNTVIPFIVDAFQNVFLPAIQTSWDMVKTMWESVLKPVWQAILPVVQWLVDGVKVALPIISDVFSTIVGAIKQVWESLLKPVFAAIKFMIETVLVPAFTVHFNTIKEVVNVAFSAIGDLWNGSLKPIFTGIIDFIVGVFTGNWSKAWEGLVSIAGGIFNGLVTVVKTPINLVIGIINGFIGGLNNLKVPDWVPGIGGQGVNIGEIPYLQSGTTSFKGGFARMNEGGRGELAMLPSGTQVIPHDVSMKYAKESAKRNSVTNNRIDSGSVIYDYRGMNEGATFIVREEADIDKIAVALQTRQDKAQARKGFRR
ncbi:phage tail protein [Candidatus Enterococcus mansonii]|uniref:Tape measure protein N-terminal domain-containing protein n=1 Tax=Candidatus Enterococcus mansonii TaxID=1834181 RepID=A0A242CHE6_9ENTE|nr:tape measure protein [Enterococcus sp. 4G2_DIV0659]OTO09631.1 hypothetical protein A5880_000310 [Enterococcus sp. 4G2_DIV0659]